MPDVADSVGGMVMREVDVVDHDFGQNFRARCVSSTPPLVSPMIGVISEPA